MQRFADRAERQNEVISHLSGEALVKVKKGMSESLASKLSILGISIQKKMNLLAGDFIVVQSHTKTIFTMIELLSDLPEVEYAEPNYTNHAPRPAAQVESTQTPWEKFVVREAAIEIIDSQIDLKTPRIKSDIKINKKTIPPIKYGDSVEDITIKDVLFISDKVPVNLAEAVEAIDYATKREVNILSNSWVRDGFSKALDEAIHVADKKGISFVAAASIAATIGSSMSAFGGYNPSSFYNLNRFGNDSVTSQTERRPASHVSAGVLSLYIAHEGNPEKTGRGRLIAKNVPSKEEIHNAWNSSSPGKDHNDIRISQDYSFPGAKFIKLEIEKLNSDTNLDLIVLRNARGAIINNISDSGQRYETDYIETNLITVEFTSNATSTSIGSIIRNVKVIY